MVIRIKNESMVLNIYYNESFKRSYSKTGNTIAYVTRKYVQNVK